MVESNAAKIIRATRQKSYYFVVSNAELEYVSKSRLLNSNEKLIWINFANKTALDSSLSCSLTQNQIAELIGKQSDSVYRAIKTLKFNGFLKAHYQNGDVATTYTLSLPEEGLAYLKSAPERGEAGSSERCIPPAKKQAPPCKNADTPPAKMHPLLINNNINNKNINHNLDAPKAAHDSEPESKPTEPPHITVSNADALICEYENLQEKYKHLSVMKRSQAMYAHFSQEDRIKMYNRRNELAAIEATKAIASKQNPAFVEKLEQANPVPLVRTNQPNVKLVEFDFDGEHFLVEEQVKNQILNQIPNLYQQNKITGEAKNKSLKTLMSEIFYYVTKVASKVLDACQLKRFYIARKLCLNGSWERPKGLERQASIQREQKWQQDKLNEHKLAKAFMGGIVKSVA